MVWLCGLLMSLTAFSIDITLPLFSEIAREFNTNIDQVPLTITFYMVFTGIGLFFFGCLSDRYGRRWILAMGLGIFIIGGLLALRADSLFELISARAIQGFGAAAPNILSRAIIRDLYTGKELAQKMAIATGIFSVGPILAPLTGAAILELGGQWNWIFLIMIAYCALLLFCLLAFTKESNLDKNVKATQLSTIANNTKTIFGNQQSRYFIAISAIIAISLLLIISTSPSVYAKTFNISGSMFALFYAVHGIGIIFGQIANHRLIDRIGIVSTSIVATIVMLVGALSISVWPLIDILSPWTVSFSITIFALGYLGVVANATSLLLQSHGDIVGFTAALQGTITMLFSGLVAGLLSVFIQENIVIWGLTIAAGPALVLMLLLRWQKTTPH